MALLAVQILLGASTEGAEPAEVPVRRVGARLEARVGTALILDAPTAFEPELRRLAGEAMEVIPALERELGLQAAAPYRILLVPPARSRSRRVARLDELAPPWAAGYLMAQQRIGAVRLDRVDRYPYGDAITTLSHEVTHMLLHDAAGDALPRWFEEGIATWQGRRWGVQDALVFSSNLLVGELPELEGLEEYFGSSSARARVAYAASFDFVSWSMRRYGRQEVLDVVQRAAVMPFEQAWLISTGVSLRQAERRWRRGSLFVYRWLPVLSGTGTLWLAITALALVAGVRRRRRTREIRARWEEEERRLELLETEEGESEERREEDSEPPGGWVH